MVRLGAILVAALFIAALASGAQAQAFGHRGRVLTPFDSHEAGARAIARYGGTKLVVAGTASNGTDRDFALARYLANGRLDPSFGSGGKVTTDLGGEDNGEAVAVDSQGRIVVAGYSTHVVLAGGAVVEQQTTMVALRYLPDGTLDPSFGVGGVARVGPGEPFAVAVDSADRVVVAGTPGFIPVSTQPWLVARLTASGQLDPSFNGMGMATGTLGGLSTTAEAVAIDHQGRIVFSACGEPEGEGPPTPSVFAVLRLLPDGTRDAGFGEGGQGAGERRVNWGNRDVCPRALAIDHRQRIVVVASHNSEMLVARLLPQNGAPDRSFGGDGRARLDFSRETPYAILEAVAVDGRNRVLLAGHVDTAPLRRARFADRYLFARLRADGRVDRRFGRRGHVAIAFGKGRTLNVGATSVLIRHGAAYAAGFATPAQETGPQGGFSLLRYRDR